MVNVGIVGCGKIADQHAEGIKRISNSKIVGVCDTTLLMAKQLYERYDVKHYYDNMTDLLNVPDMDVIHITTPPQSHYKLGKLCLEAGVNVYMEKPFTLNTNEAKELIALAQKRGLKITAGHNAQFTHAARYMRGLIDDGYLGGPPVHMESYYCYNFSDELFAKVLLGDKNHWVRSLPGKLLHNIISHGITKIAEFIKGSNPTVIACGFTSPLLKKIGENGIIDELRVIIHDDENTTAFFTFSSQFCPSLHRFQVWGPKNSLLVDDDNQTVIKLQGKTYKSYLNHFIPPLVYAREYLKNNYRNLKNFLKNDFHNDAGMKYLIESFHTSLSHGKPLPISYREILLTSQIMDDIFEQIYDSHRGEK